jgi:hypothetical protein
MPSFNKLAAEGLDPVKSFESSFELLFPLVISHHYYFADIHKLLADKLFKN